MSTSTPPDRTTRQPRRNYAVYWRARDGQGTHIWRTDLTHAECETEIKRCQEAYPEATLVWALDDSNRARMQEKLHG